MSGGRLVEFVRFIFVTLFALAGYEIAVRVATAEGETWRAGVGIVIGAGVGYVFGGFFGRQTAQAVSAVEKEFRRAPAAEVAAGVAGLIVGLVVALLLSVPIFQLPPPAAWPVVAFLSSWSLLAVHRLVAWEVPILGWRLALLRYAACALLPIVAGFAARAISRV